MNEKLYALEDSLNNIIDSEIKHIKCNGDLICEAVDGLLRLENFDKYIISTDEKNCRINKIFNQTNDRKKDLRNIIRIILIAALIAALMSVAVLAYVGIEYKITKFSDYSTVLSNIIAHKDLGDLNVEYIPERFELTYEETLKTMVLQEYTSNETYDHINIIKKKVNSVDINTEVKDYNMVVIDRIEYICFGEKEHGMGIIWFTENFQYEVDTSLPLDEALKIAQSIS